MKKKLFYNQHDFDMEKNMFEPIIDNYITKKKVGDFLKNSIKDDAEISIVSAYFTIYAFNELKDSLNKTKEFKFLFGEPTFIKNMKTELLPQKEFEIEDNTFKISIKNRLKQKFVAQQCYKWIKKSNVYIKSMIKPNFLHGKIYYIQNKDRDPIALVGSSNFTYSGLGFGNSKNIELNIEIDSKRDTINLKKWFDEIWNKSNDTVQDVKKEVLKYIETLYKDNSPEYIYYLTLYNIFSDYRKNTLQLPDENLNFNNTLIWNKLFDFQQDGVKSAINKILKYNGCIIADSVGLGKTFEALAVIKYFELKNYKVLVLCPKKLRENWIIYRNNDERNIFVKDRFSFDVLSHTDLSRDTGYTGDINLENINWGNYDLVVIDESHNFRNNTRSRRDENGDIIRKSRYDKLIEDIIKSGVQTKTLLLSATPVNNDLKDLKNQINIITGENDNFFKSIDINSVNEIMRVAQSDFNSWAKTENSVKDLISKLNISFLKLLDELTIARSRKHIEKYYDLDKIGKFPVRLEPLSIYSEIDLDDKFLSFEKIDEIIDQFKLSLYNPSAYVYDEFKAKYNIKDKKSFNEQSSNEYYLIGMMKINFLKRLESSIHSFSKTLENTLKKIEDLLFEIIEFESEKFKDENFKGDINPFKDIDEDIIDENEELNFQVGKKMKFNLKHIDINSWKTDLKKDKNMIENLLNLSKAITSDRDGKLKELKDIMKEKIENPFNGSNKKIIVFTAFADTAEYLYDNLKDYIFENFNLYSAIVTGGSSCKTNFELKSRSNFDSILINFSPISKNRDKMRSMPQNGEIDILIATDCISEGQNLQDCDCVINYDIHWNPVRIIQRFGRIDRLGSKNSLIKMINFWPTEDFDSYINLKTRVETRMILVNIASTGENSILGTHEIESSINYRENQLKKMKNEILNIEDFENSVSLSDFTLDDFRVDLSNFIKINKNISDNSPKGVYAIVEREKDKKDEKYRDIIPSGTIFCLKIDNKNDFKKLNPLTPYFLVYAKDNGEIKYNYIKSKQILDIYRLLCKDKKEASEMLEEIFKKETSDYENLDIYSSLLENSISNISESIEKQEVNSIINNRNAQILPFDNQITTNSNFELISWLIIK